MTLIAIIGCIVGIGIIWAIIMYVLGWWYLKKLLIKSGRKDNSHNT